MAIVSGSFGGVTTGLLPTSLGGAAPTSSFASRGSSAFSSQINALLSAMGFFGGPQTGSFGATGGSDTTIPPWLNDLLAFDRPSRVPKGIGGPPSG